jgi:hypothetical protein
MRATELLVPPACDVVGIAERGNAFVLNGREDGAANQTLAAGVALAFGVARAGREPDSLSPQTGETFVEGLNSRADILSVRHAPIARAPFQRGREPRHERNGLKCDGIGWHARRGSRRHLTRTRPRRASGFERPAPKPGRLRWPRSWAGGLLASLDHSGKPSQRDRSACRRDRRLPRTAAGSAGSLSRDSDWLVLSVRRPSRCSRMA